MSHLCRLRTKTHGEDGQWAYEEITKLREQVAAQAAVIEKLREALAKIAENALDFWSDYVAKTALTITTDSTQILDDVRRAERERCAKVCEAKAAGARYVYQREELTELAAAIRAME